jgi:hypothetical protein
MSDDRLSDGRLRAYRTTEDVRLARLQEEIGEVSASLARAVRLIDGIDADVRAIKATLEKLEPKIVRTDESVKGGFAGVNLSTEFFLKKKPNRGELWAVVLGGFGGVLIALAYGFHWL